MRSKLHIGIVGAGNIVKQRHLPALLSMPNVEIVAVSNSTYASSERFCNEFLPHATPLKNWAELVSLPDLDIVWIGTHPNMHAPISISALEAGRHVFCQARMAMNLQEAEEMLAASQKRPHLVTALCPAPHGMRGGRLVKHLLADSFIGRPTHVRLQSFSSAYLDPNAPAHWRQKIEINGLNVLTLGIYIEVLQHWLGPIRSVEARTKIVHRYRGHYEVKSPDIVNVLVEFANGAEGVLEFNGVAAFPPGDKIEIYGEQGVIRYDIANDRITAGRVGDDRPEEMPIPPELVTEWTVEHDFIRAVCDPTAPRPRPSFKEGVDYMRVVSAVHESALIGKCVDIPV